MMDQLSLFVKPFGPPCVVDLVASVYQLLTSDVSGFVQQRTGASLEFICQEKRRLHTSHWNCLFWNKRSEDLAPKTCRSGCKNGTFKGQHNSPLFTLNATIKTPKLNVFFFSFFKPFEFLRINVFGFDLSIDLLGYQFKFSPAFTGRRMSFVGLPDPNEPLPTPIPH